MLATAIAAAECAQVGEGYDHDDGLLSPVFSVSRVALASKFDSAPLFVGHEGALVPAKQCPHSAQRKELEDPHARVDASRQRETDLEDARVAVEAELEDVHRTAADAPTFLESELEQEHAAPRKNANAQRSSRAASGASRAGSRVIFCAEKQYCRTPLKARAGARAETVGCGGSCGAREDGGWISGVGGAVSAL